MESKAYAYRSRRARQPLSTSTRSVHHPHLWPRSRPAASAAAHFPRPWRRRQPSDSAANCAPSLRASSLAIPSCILAHSSRCPRRDLNSPAPASNPIPSPIVMSSAVSSSCVSSWLYEISDDETPHGGKREQKTPGVLLTFFRQAAYQVALASLAAPSTAVLSPRGGTYRPALLPHRMCRSSFRALFTTPDVTLASLYAFSPRPALLRSRRSHSITYRCIPSPRPPSHQVLFFS